MKCYYEELNIPQDAADGDIKTAYRKLALRWHPDKNPDQAEEAKEKFQLIQQAYEVLSDAHERAWYDKHRDQILRGKNSDYEENCLDLFQYFTVTCFKGYGDDEKGFYAVYSEVFEKIAAEDTEFMDDEEEIAKIPKFGNSQSSYEEIVAPFYAFWQAYCTKKNYAWLCKYDIQEIKERRILREIEKEMKKIVLKAKKERNEEVRNLVAFVRKRDKRVQAYKTQLEQRVAQNRQKQQQIRLEQIRKRQRELKEVKENAMQDFHQEYEEQLKQLEQEYNDSNTDNYTHNGEAENNGIDSLESDDDEYIGDLYCVACNKTFKNQNAFANHETSKKHKENIERVRIEMEEEEELYNKDLENLSIESEGEVTKNIEDNDVPTCDTDEESNSKLKTKQNKKSKKSKKSNRANLKIMSDGSELEDSMSDFITKKSEDDADWTNSSKKATRKSKAKKQIAVLSKSQTTQLNVPEAEVPKTVKEASAEVRVLSERELSAIKLDNEILTNISHMCVTCQAVFNSKNKLFNHLKLLNHGVYIPKAKQEAENVINGKKSKGKRK